jgi:hypothetical protein
MAVRVVIPGTVRADARESSPNLGQATVGYVYTVLETFTRDGIEYLRLLLPVFLTDGSVIGGGEAWIKAYDVVQAGDAGDPVPPPAAKPGDADFLAAMKVVRAWMKK